VNDIVFLISMLLVSFTAAAAIITLLIVVVAFINVLTRGIDNDPGPV
jgi:hypothetical protein